MKSVFTAIAAAAAAALAAGSEVSNPTQPNLLIFSKASGYRHDRAQSIPNAIELVSSVAKKNNWTYKATEDHTIFHRPELKTFTTLVFLHTTGLILEDRGYEAMYQHLLSGASWLGIHSAADFWNHTPPWYTNLVGGNFQFHPCSPEWTCSDAQRERYPPYGGVRPDIITLQDTTHPSTVNLPPVFNRTDEWYSYIPNPSLSSNYTILATLNETYIDDVTPSYLSMKPEHPISWHSLFEGKARAWYTGMGHTIETYSDELFIKHVTGGLEWVTGTKD
ncbi:class I glutamine amidotransferase-like protein [Byssothecium circinans]|uniref:Class I glutamine amidotransferase-like protein n=1 Tax=Byssothecium circinans TaxID=147558 RepID=A0A6A5TRB2_9PLEO|nr:class I glutamine amidotransferase-like protein [Byssothecium circinans]